MQESSAHTAHAVLGTTHVHVLPQVLGTPCKEDIRAMNPNYTDFKFPQIKAHPWGKVFSKRMPADAVDLVSTLPCLQARLPVQREAAGHALRGQQAAVTCPHSATPALPAAAARSC